MSIEQFENNILDLIKQAKKYSENVAFIGFLKVDETKVVPLPWNAQKSYFNQKIVTFDHKLEEICFKNHIYYLNVYNLLSLDEFSDGLHPNCIGHQKLCNEIANFLDKLL